MSSPINDILKQFINISNHRALKVKKGIPLGMALNTPHHLKLPVLQNSDSNQQFFNKKLMISKDHLNFSPSTKQYQLKKSYSENLEKNIIDSKSLFAVIHIQAKSRNISLKLGENLPRKSFIVRKKSVVLNKKKLEFEEHKKSVFEYKNELIEAKLADIDKQISDMLDENCYGNSKKVNLSQEIPGEKKVVSHVKRMRFDRRNEKTRISIINKQTSSGVCIKTPEKQTAGISPSDLTPKMVRSSVKRLRLNLQN